jgi:hypothetical protein
MTSPHNQTLYFYRKSLLVLLCTIALSSCYSVRVQTHTQPASEMQYKTVNSFFWGIVQSPQNVVTPICDSLGSNGLAEVTVKNNFGYSLITVVTLGIWSPTRIEWKCGKPCQKVGKL